MGGKGVDVGLIANLFVYGLTKYLAKHILTL